LQLPQYVVLPYFNNMYAFLLSIALVIVSASADTIPINLGNCSRFALKAATDISFNGKLTAVKTGDIGISPGKGLSGSYTHTGSILLNTKETSDCDRDFTLAYNQAMAMSCDAANIFPELAGKTLSPGVYCSGSSMKISASTVTLDGKGDANAQWVFQVPSALTTATTTSFILQNGAQSKNVFWAIGTSATIAYSSSFIGATCIDIYDFLTTKNDVLPAIFKCQILISKILYHYSKH
jgi:hypothetical protein